MVDEIQIVTRCDGHGAAAAASHTGVGLMQRLVDKDERRDDSITVAQWQRNVVTDWRDIGWRYVLDNVQHNIHVHQI